MTLVTAKDTFAWTRIAAPIYTQSGFHTVAIFGNDVVNTLTLAHGASVCRYSCASRPVSPTRILVCYCNDCTIDVK